MFIRVRKTLTGCVVPFFPSGLTVGNRRDRVPWNAGQIYNLPAGMMHEKGERMYEISIFWDLNCELLSNNARFSQSLHGRESRMRRRRKTVHLPFAFLDEGSSVERRFWRFLSLKHRIGLDFHMEVVWTFMKFKICLYFWGVFGPWRGSVASYMTDERAKNGQKERWRLNLEELKLQIESSSEKFRRLRCLEMD